MARRSRLLKLALYPLGALAFFVTSLWLLGAALSPKLGIGARYHTAEEKNAGKAVRDVRLDPDHLPVIYKDIQVQAKGEAPVLAQLVADGKLPPVAERTGEEPAVMEGADGIGKYGGTWLRLASSDDDINLIENRMSSPYLVRWSPMGYPVKPHIAKSVEHSPDSRVWTITLRKGMKWSDGFPFTTADIKYWWECEINNAFVNNFTIPTYLLSQGKPAKLDFPSPTVFTVTFDDPNPLFLENLAFRLDPCSVPEHYLRQYHPDPKIGNQELIERERKADGIPSARALYTYIKGWQNPEHPRLWPWVYRSYRPTAPQVFVRNPYYFAVDPAGNQLPYIDRIQVDVADSRVMAIKIANGDASMQDRYTRFSDYTELMSRQEVANTRVLHWYTAIRSPWIINPNITRRTDPKEPDLAKKAELLADKRFRQALSVAIDRNEIINSEYQGFGTPSQVAPGPDSPFRHDKIANAFTQFDPRQANRLLDELGLTRRDLEGYRTFRDGTRMTFFLDYCVFTGVGPALFVTDDWAKVGLRVVARERARPLYYAEKDAMNFDMNVWTSESDMFPLIEPRVFMPNTSEALYAVGYGRWWMHGGLFGNPDANRPGHLAPPPGSPIRKEMELYAEALRTTDPAAQKKLMDQILDIAADNVWTISISTPTPALAVISKDLKNVPEHAMMANILQNPGNTGEEVWYFDHPSNSPGADADTRNSIVTPVPRPGTAANASADRTGKIISTCVWSIIGLSLLLLALRHPFIGRRLLIMIPTLAIISVIIFTIIQLPPGDFLSARVTYFQESGEPNAAGRVEDLKGYFHNDESKLSLYCRWTGLKWFTTFKASDKGLLQGDMGRSMESLQPINRVVGDRIWFTLAISVATLLVTWAIALPIGIYSAVKQYSLGDYALTLFGFLGMCVPAFLLALILMALSGASGLFSPEFAARPEWSWPKFLDLLKHMWVPVVVLGIGGTAGMIRVMRANLLDELKKPYVTTALAKGVRPTKLLMKYPVRLALNPFVSSIGGLFPALISGNAIVSMVLALPTVGPLMLNALFVQDTYLAGSMLMILSLLGVLGTLVSDLLLLWIDPRIRFGGGTR